MPKKLISIRVPSEDLEQIDRIAATNKLTRSSLIETLVRSFLSEDFFLQRAIVREAHDLLAGTQDS